MSARDSFNDWSQGRVLYMAVGATPGQVKIGYTGDVAARTRNLRTGDPTLTMQVTFTVSDPNDNVLSSVQSERAIHKHLADRRVTGEWFTGTVEELLDLIDKVRMRTPCTLYKKPIEISVDVRTWGVYDAKQEVPNTK